MGASRVPPGIRQTCGVSEESATGFQWSRAVAAAAAGLVVFVVSVLSGVGAVLIAAATDGLPASYYDGGNRAAFGMAMILIPMFVVPAAMLVFAFVLGVWHRCAAALVLALVPTVCLWIAVPFVVNH